MSEEQTVYDGDTSGWADNERALLETIQRHRAERISITDREDFGDVLIEVYFPDGGMSQATGTTRLEALRNAGTTALAWDRASAGSVQQTDAEGPQDAVQELPTEEEFAEQAPPAHDITPEDEA